MNYKEKQQIRNFGYVFAISNALESYTPFKNDRDLYFKARQSISDLLDYHFANTNMEDDNE